MTTKVMKKNLPIELLPVYGTLRTPEERKSFLELFAYFNGMRESMDIDVSSEDYRFLTEGKTFLSKKEINKFLFAKIKGDKFRNGDLSSKENLLEITADICKKIDSYPNECGPARELKESIDNLRHDISNYSQQISRWATQLLQNQKKLEGILRNSNFSVNFLKAVDKIILSGEYSRIYFDAAHFMLFGVTRTDCILEENGSSINFGKICVSYSAKTGDYVFSPYENNILVDTRFFHPHLFQEGRMCYGTAQAAVTEYFESGEIAKVYSIANMILHAYNPASPVMPFNDFVDRGQIMEQVDYKSYYTDVMHGKFCHKDLFVKIWPNHLGAFTDPKRIFEIKSEELKEKDAA